MERRPAIAHTFVSSCYNYYHVVYMNIRHSGNPIKGSRVDLTYSFVIILFVVTLRGSEECSPGYSEGVRELFSTRTNTGLVVLKNS